MLFCFSVLDCYLFGDFLLVWVCVITFGLVRVLNDALNCWCVCCWFGMCLLLLFGVGLFGLLWSFGFTALLLCLVFYCLVVCLLRLFVVWLVAGLLTCLFVLFVWLFGFLGRFVVLVYLVCLGVWTIIFGVCVVLLFAYFRYGVSCFVDLFIWLFICWGLLVGLCVWREFLGFIVLIVYLINSVVPFYFYNLDLVWVFVLVG